MNQLLYEMYEICLSFIDAHVKRQTWKKYSSLIIWISFQVVKFISDGFKKFVNTLCYNNDESCDLSQL
jgi:hypothetical protein